MKDRHSAFSLTPERTSQLLHPQGDMSPFCAPHLLGPLRIANQQDNTMDVDMESEVESTDTEMSDGGPLRIGPYLRLTGTQSALIRFLKMRNVKPREIQAHPDCGWSVPTIICHGDMKGPKDDKYLTSDFYRILKEIKTKKKELKQFRKWDPPKRQLRKCAKPSGASTVQGHRTGVVTRQAANVDQGNQVRHEKEVDLQAKCPSSELSACPTDQTFLRRFVESPALDPECADILKEVGFTSAEKLCRVAAWGKEDLAKFVETRLSAMTSLDRELFIQALLRLAKSEF
ncbi:hypothetical protein DFH06DRAFT_1296858 [Mycena polygramma]|nr:hypothetical protein DFH06DRAFT_1475839 [Mycena polygramma]KAJ7660773.1 hypothetical protein DFH06DRAFT_1296858 [Mycena polygramma]